MFLSTTLSVVCSMLICQGMASNIPDIEKQSLDSILAPNNYDPDIRPHGINGSGPVVVRFNTYIRSISDIDDVKMDYVTQLTFRMTWKDSRLKYDNRGGNIKYLTLTHPEKIWRPDVFFSNEKDGHFHNILRPNVLIRIYPDGEILYSIRLSVTLSCKMDLRDYPMDRQTCSIIMASYSYTTKELAFLWKLSDPVQIKRNLNLPIFTLEKFITDYCTSRTNTGEYACIRIDLLFSRQLNYYLLQVYIPCMFLVILSWISFWLDYRATNARLAIWLTILLSMLIITSNFQARTPAVSYTKAIDVWIGTCLTFLFVVIIELVLVTHAVKTEDNQRNQKSLMSIDDHGASNTSNLSSKFSLLRRLLNRYPSRGQRMDVISRILFPLVFAFFNLIYWTSYGHGGQDDDN